MKMVEYLDSHIGRIFQTLEKQRQLNNTLIIFTSDNGGMLSGNCWPLKKNKQHLEEGGIRVPLLMRWPGKIPAGTVSDKPSIMMDASVTVLAASDALKHVPEGRVLDGINLLEKSEAPRDFGWRRRDWGRKEIIYAKKRSAPATGSCCARSSMSATRNGRPSTKTNCSI